MLIFSKIDAKATTGEIYTGLVSGIPNGLSDLDGWKCFEHYLACLDSCTVTVDVTSFGYGEGFSYEATPEEVAYMYQRRKMRPDFLETRCEYLGDSQFSFDWEPDELFN